MHQLSGNNQLFSLHERLTPGDYLPNQKLKYSKDAAKEATAHCSEASTSEGCNDDIDRVSFQEKTMDRSIESCSNLSELSISAAPIKNNSDSLAGKVSAHLQQLAALISTHKLSADFHCLGGIQFKIAGPAGAAPHCEPSFGG